MKTKITSFIISLSLFASSQVLNKGTIVVEGNLLVGGNILLDTNSVMRVESTGFVYTVDSLVFPIVIDGDTIY